MIEIVRLAKAFTGCGEPNVTVNSISGLSFVEGLALKKPGSWGAQIIDEIARQPDDVIVVKKVIAVMNDPEINGHGVQSGLSVLCGHNEVMA
jgi:nicotinamidase-related amidase